MAITKIGTDALDDGAITTAKLASAVGTDILASPAITGNLTTNGLIDGRDVAADGVTADAALPKAGGAMTGAITTNSTFDGVDIATRDALLTSTISDVALKATLASPSLTGVPVAPTAAGNTTTTQLATTAFVQQEITTLIGGAPSTLNDLNELAAAINDDANYNSTLTTALATKAPLAAPALTGTVTAASHVQIAGNLDVVGQIGAYNNPGSSWGAMVLRATDYTFKNSGGTIKVAIDSNGKVGIGTTSPTELLHIKNPSNSWNEYARIRIGTETSDSYASEIGFHRGTSSDVDRGLFLDGSGAGNQQLKVLVNGNVGIGTATPLSLDGNAAPGLTIKSNGPYILLQDGNNADKVRYISNNTGQFQFGIVGDNGTSGKTEHMRIDTNGNVGIGSTSPAFKLVVAHNSRNGMEFVPNASDAGTNILQNYNRGTSAYTPFRIAGKSLTIQSGTNAQYSWAFDESGNLASPDSGGHFRIASSFGFTADGTGNGAGVSGTNVHFNGATVNPTAISTHGSYGANGIVYAWGGHMKFFTNEGAVTAEDALTERMVIKGNGQVMVGSPTPNSTYKFGVYSGDYVTMEVRAPTYPTIKFRALNQNSANGGSISVGASNSFNLQPNNATYGISISNAGEVTLPAQPAFSARGNTSQWLNFQAGWQQLVGGIAAGSGGTIGVNWSTTTASDRIGYNIGGDFVPSNGRFTASIAGRYSFRASVYMTRPSSTASHYVHMLLYVNEVQLNELYTIAGEGMASGLSQSLNIDANLNLSAGDYVTVRIYCAATGAFQVYADHTNFSGYLIG